MALTRDEAGNRLSAKVRSPRSGMGQRTLAASLHHIALASPEPEALASFHKRAMGLQLRETHEGLLGEAPGRRTFFVPGKAKTLGFAGFAVQTQADLDSLRSRLEASDYRFEVREKGTTLFQPGAVAVSDPDGNNLIFGCAREPGQSSEGLPARLQHLVVASRNATRLSMFYQNSLGFLLSDNVVDEKGGLRTAFLRCSEEHHSFAVFQASSDRLDHHCYETPNWDFIRDWGDHFASQEIAIKWGPGRHGPGNNLFLFVHDIDGNWLELSAELEVVDVDRPVKIWPHTQRTLNSWGSAPLRS